MEIRNFHYFYDTPCEICQMLKLILILSWTYVVQFCPCKVLKIESYNALVRPISFLVAINLYSLNNFTLVRMTRISDQSSMTWGCSMEFHPVSHSPERMRQVTLFQPVTPTSRETDQAGPSPLIPILPWKKKIAPVYNFPYK